MKVHLTWIGVCRAGGGRVQREPGAVRSTRPIVRSSRPLPPATAYPTCLRRPTAQPQCRGAEPALRKHRSRQPRPLRRTRSTQQYQPEHRGRSRRRRRFRRTRIRKRPTRKPRSCRAIRPAATRAIRRSPNSLCRRCRQPPVNGSIAARSPCPIEKSHARADGEPARRRDARPGPG